MRKFMMAATAIVALAVPATSMANASHNPATHGANAGVTENGWLGSPQGNSQQYSATYSDPVFGGPITCNGVHLTKQNQDSFTCTVNKGDAWTNVPYVGETINWNSDFYGVKDPNTTHNGSMTIQSVGHDANGNVTSYTGLATYTS